MKYWICQGRGSAINVTTSGFHWQFKAITDKASSLYTMY